jgi:hypothetical protein
MIGMNHSVNVYAVFLMCFGMLHVAVPCEGSHCHCCYPVVKVSRGPRGPSSGASDLDVFEPRHLKIAKLEPGPEPRLRTNAKRANLMQ